MDKVGHFWNMEKEKIILYILDFEPYLVSSNVLMLYFIIFCYEPALCRVWFTYICVTTSYFDLFNFLQLKLGSITVIEQFSNMFLLSLMLERKDDAMFMCIQCKLFVYYIY